MHDLTDIDLGRPARRLRVDTLSRLRWLAVAGQAAAVLFTYYGLGFPLPLFWCLFVIALSGAVNIGLRLRFPVSHRLDDTPATILLGYDLLQLSVLLFLTGGLENPFAMLFLAPVMISAASLSPMRTLFLGALTGLAATVLVNWHFPLPWHPGEELRLPFLFSAGIWVAIVLGVAFIGIYASRVAEEARQLSDALAATELVLAREQHLTQLDGLAAAAAHELGTPLATITLVVKEMMQLVKVTGPALETVQIREDLDLLDQEVRRCRTILGKIASLGDEKSGPAGGNVAQPSARGGRGAAAQFRRGGRGVPARQRARADLPAQSRHSVWSGQSGRERHRFRPQKRPARSPLDPGYCVAWQSATTGRALRPISCRASASLMSPRAGRGGAPRRKRAPGSASACSSPRHCSSDPAQPSSTTNAALPATGAIVTVSWPRATFERDRMRRAGGGSRRPPILFMRAH